MNTTGQTIQKESSESVSRMIIPDLLKGIAVVLMIQVHLTELFAVSTWTSGIGGKISLFLGGPFAAPIFMAIMGYFVARQQKTLVKSLLHGAKLIFWGLLLNLGLNAHMLVKIAFGHFHLNPWHYIFGVDILFLAGLSVIFIAIFHFLFKKQLVIWLLLLVLVGFSNEYIPVYGGPHQWIRLVQAYFWGYYEWSYFPLFPWAAYPVAGFIFYLIEQQFQISRIAEKWLLILALMLFVLIAFTFNFGFTISTTLHAYYHHSGVFMLWVLAFIMLYMLVVRLFRLEYSNTWINTWLMWVGKNVTSFYVFQWLLIGNIATLRFRSEYPLQLFFWFVFITAMSTLLVFIWKKHKRFIQKTPNKTIP